MFERFYRASNAKALKPNGTGLGLNIAKVLAEKIGAEISFESEENKGSTFYLRIPKRSSRGAEARNKS
jgi:signal transduction histidine kinase